MCKGNKVMSSFYNVIKKISDEKIKYEIARFSSLAAWILLSISLLLFKDIRFGRFGLIHDLPLLYFVSIFFSLLSGFITMGIKHEKRILQFINLIFLLTRCGCTHYLKEHRDLHQHIRPSVL